MTNEIGVGKEVLSYCGKCKLVLAHTIAVMKTATVIGKCECKTCHATHLYRDPDAPAKKKKAPSVKAAAERPWGEAVANAKGSLKPYSMTSHFNRGNLLDHPVFGKGVVERVIESNKIEALFEQGMKILMHSPQ